VPSLATNYERGRAFEYRVRDYLMNKLDACYVMRAAGSHTIADLCAFFIGTDAYDAEFKDAYVHPNVWLVQCKRDGRLSAEERELLHSLAKETGAVAMLAKAGPGGRGVIIEEVQVG
jgi:hypothetical protein